MCLACSFFDVSQQELFRQMGHLQVQLEKEISLVTLYKVGVSFQYLTFNVLDFCGVKNVAVPQRIELLDFGSTSPFWFDTRPVFPPPCLYT
jgi:hypothetical protein